MFFFIDQYAYILMGISLLLTLCGAVLIFRKNSLLKVKNSLMKFSLFKGKFLVILSILLVLVLSCFMVPMKAGLRGKADISLNYAKASQGLNPNGTRYNPSGILSPEILENVLRKGAFPDVTIQDLQRVLSVSPKVQGSSRSEDRYFISTQFVVRYNGNKDTMHLNGETLLNLTVESYKEWFMNTYSDNTSVLDLSFEEMDQEDYLDICEYLTQKAKLITNYMNRMASYESSSFRSPSNGETFQSIASQSTRVSDVMVQKLRAYLLENSVSKSSNLYMSRLSFQNVFYYFDYLKEGHSNQNYLNAISMYEEDMARIVLVPTFDKDYQFYMSQTRIGIDDFAQEAEAHANDKTSISSSIARNDHILRQLSMSRQIGGTDEKAEQLIVQIEDALIDLAGKAQTIVEEYGEDRANQYISVHVSSQEGQFKSNALKVCFLTGCFAASVYCMAFAVFVNRQKQEAGGTGGKKQKWISPEGKRVNAT